MNKDNTLPKTHIALWKLMVGKWDFLLGCAIFRGLYVFLKECTNICIHNVCMIQLHVSEHPNRNKKSSITTNPQALKSPHVSSIELTIHMTHWCHLDIIFGFTQKNPTHPAHRIPA